MLKFFPELVANHSKVKSNQIAFRFFQGSIVHRETLSFSELWKLSASLAFTLQSQGLSGRRILLVCKSEKFFVIAFYACLMAGAVAVPTAVPRRKNLFNRLKLLESDAQISATISDVDGFSNLRSTWSNDELVHVDMETWFQSENHVDHALCWTLPDINKNSIAFLQYTSGSTGNPKGVMVTHGNLISNCEAIRLGLDLSDQSSMFNVMPLFHDLGSICGVLAPMYVGCVGSFMSPSEVIQYPERWLNIISNYKVTCSGGPDFMFDLAARAVNGQDIDGCSLASWKVAYCGAEPIRCNTIESFSKRFHQYNFQPEAFSPCYGLAESTLYVSGDSVHTVPRISDLHGSKAVGCGVPFGDTHVEIVHPETHVRVTGCDIGEIWVRSKSVAKGYWNHEALTEQVFKATIYGEPGTCFLRTGDLGYMENDHLFVTGRLKDLIIIYGKKYIPQDLEYLVEQCHAAIGSSRCAAYNAFVDGAERLIFSLELNREWMHKSNDFLKIIEIIRTKIYESFDIAVYDVVLLRPGALPRTSSGKLRRNQCRDDYLSEAESCLATYRELSK